LSSLVGGAFSQPILNHSNPKKPKSKGHPTSLPLSANSFILSHLRYFAAANLSHIFHVVIHSHILKGAYKPYRGFLATQRQLQHKILNISETKPKGMDYTHIRHHKNNVWPVIQHEKTYSSMPVSTIYLPI
jgi:hypothetical protein